MMAALKDSFRTAQNYHETHRTLSAALLCLTSQRLARPPERDAPGPGHAAQVEQFLQVQAAGLPGEVTVTVGAIDPRMSWPPAPIHKLSSCRRARLGQDHGRRALRSTFPWTIYIQANVTVVGDYLASAAPLVQGQSIDGNHHAQGRPDHVAGRHRHRCQPGDGP
jgi:flagella basal body P-ring formation protein FlgA